MGLFESIGSAISGVVNTVTSKFSSLTGGSGSSGSKSTSTGTTPTGTTPSGSNYNTKSDQTPTVTNQQQETTEQILNNPNYSVSYKQSILRMETGNDSIGRYLGAEAGKAHYGSINTPATEAMVVKKAELIGRKYAAGIITSETTAKELGTLSRQYQYTTDSLTNIMQQGAAKELQNPTLTTPINQYQSYRVSYVPAGGLSAGAESARTVIVPGIALMKPSLLPSTKSFMTGEGSVYAPTMQEKEGKYTYVGAVELSQHGSTRLGWLYVSDKDLYFLAKPAKEIIGVGSLGQEVPMSGGEGAWGGMLESGKLTYETLLQLPEGAKISAISEAGTGKLIYEPAVKLTHSTKTTTEPAFGIMGLTLAAQGATGKTQEISAYSENKVLPTWEESKSIFSEEQQAIIERGISLSGTAASISFKMQEASKVTSVETEKQIITLPVIGEVPFISEFLPTTIKTTYASGAVTTKEGETPFTTSIRSTLPEPYTQSADSVIKGSILTLSVIPGANLATIPMLEMFEAEKILGSEPVISSYESLRGFATNAINAPQGQTLLLIAKNPLTSVILPQASVGAIELEAFSNTTPETINVLSGFVPGTPEYLRDTYSGVYEDPAKSLISAGIGISLPVAGGLLRSVGVGTKYLAPVVTAEGPSLGFRLYTGASKVISASLLAIYSSDLMKRTTGITPGDIATATFGSVNPETGEFTRGGLSELQKKFNDNYPGLKESRRQINIASTQEILPAMFGYSGGMVVADKLADIVTLRKTPQIPTELIRTRAYLAEEGFATSSEITTQALEDSFNVGTLVLESESGLGRATMAPYGKPLTRVPVGTQIGVESGKSRVFSGSEVPYMQQGGMIGFGSSEIDAAFVSPVGYSYFTKPGSGPFGLGISSDILGIYRTPTLNQILLESEINKIPEDLLSTPTRGKGANNPRNPRNIAITRYMTEKAKFGKLYVGQYGKAEWQGLIRPGTSIKTSELSGWYSDAGRRIRVQDVTLGGKAKGYSPKTQFEIAKFYSELGLSAESTSISSQKTPLISIRSGFQERSQEISEGYISAFNPVSYLTSGKGISESSLSKSLASSEIFSGESLSKYAKSYSGSKSSSQQSSIKEPSYESYESSVESSLPISSLISTLKYNIVTTPVSTPVTTPLSPPVTTPVSTPVTTPPYTPTTTPQYNPPTIPTGGSPFSAGTEGGDFRYRGKKTWVNVHPVGADIVKKSQGSMPDFRKFRMKKFPKF